MRIVSTGKILLFLLLFFTPRCCAYYQLHQDVLLTNGLNGHIEQSRASFEAIYYQLVEKGLFPASYNNNLVIKSDLHEDIQKEGMIILRLIEWLEKQDDQECSLLLEKLNYLYFLELHAMLSRMNLKELTPGPNILALCQDLYYVTFPTKPVSTEPATGAGERAPFRGSLSKLFLMINIINDNQLHYEARKETLAFALEGVKREMLAINESLGIEKLDSEIIKSFVTLLEVHSAREPVIEKHNIRKIVTVVVLLAITGFFVYRYRDQIGGYVTEFLDSLFTEFFKRSGAGLYKGVREAADRDIVQMNANIDDKVNLVNEHVDRVNGHVNGLARGIDHMMANVDGIGEQFARGALHGLVAPDQVAVAAAGANQAAVGANQAAAANPEVAILANQLLHGALTGQPHQPNYQAGQINPDLEIVRNHMAGAAGLAGRPLYGVHVPPPAQQAGGFFGWFRGAN